MFRRGKKERVWLFPSQEGTLWKKSRQKKGKKEVRFRFCEGRRKG